MEILGIGSAMEPLGSFTGIREDGFAISQAMKKAIAQLPNGRQIDAIVLHAPGTILGDAAELRAITELFGSTYPTLASTKWITGHLFGATGMVSLELARFLLDGGTVDFPYQTMFKPATPNPDSCSTVLINTAGFGGVAVSLIVGKV